MLSKTSRFLTVVAVILLCFVGEVNGGRKRKRSKGRPQGGDQNLEESSTTLNTMLQLASSAESSGQAGDALSYYHKSIVLAKRVQAPTTTLLELYQAAIRLTRQAGDTGKLSALLREVIDLATLQQTGATPPLAEMSELATLEERSGRLLNAVEVLERAVALSPATPQLRNHAGALLLRLSKPREAAVHFDQAVRTQQNLGSKHNVDLYAFSLGIALATLHDHSGALKAFTTANASRVVGGGSSSLSSSSRSGFPEAVYHMGRCFDRLGRYREAVHSFSSVLPSFGRGPKEEGVKQQQQQVQIRGGLSQVRWELHDSLLSLGHNLAALHQLAVSIREEKEASAAADGKISAGVSGVDPRLTYGALHLSRYVAHWGGMTSTTTSEEDGGNARSTSPSVGIESYEQTAAFALRTLRGELSKCRNNAVNANSNSDMDHEQQQAAAAASTSCGTELTPMRAMAWVPAPELNLVMQAWQAPLVAAAQAQAQKKSVRTAFSDQSPAEERKKLLWQRHQGRFAELNQSRRKDRNSGEVAGQQQQQQQQRKQGIQSSSRQSDGTKTTITTVKTSPEHATNSGRRTRHYADGTTVVLNDTTGLPIDEASSKGEGSSSEAPIIADPPKSEKGNKKKTNKKKSKKQQSQALVVGYVSADWDTHHPMTPIVRSLLAAQQTTTQSTYGADAPSLHIICFDIAQREAMAQQQRQLVDKVKSYKGLCDEFVDVFSDDNSKRMGSSLPLSEKMDSNKSPEERAFKSITTRHVDVLIDLNGYTKGGWPELFARRPAPVQALWLGWPVTGGSTHMYDFAITDPVVQPPESPGLKLGWTEALVLLPRGSLFPPITSAVLGPPPSFGITSTTRSNFSSTKQEEEKVDKDMPEGKIPEEREHDCDCCGEETFSRQQQKASAARAALGIPDGAFVMAAFNQHFKTSPRLLDAWAGAIKRIVEGIALTKKDTSQTSTQTQKAGQEEGDVVNGGAPSLQQPSSSSSSSSFTTPSPPPLPRVVLWLLEHPAEGLAGIKSELSSRGLDPHVTVVTSPFEADREAHVLRLGLVADVFLDSGGGSYSGGATVADALLAAKNTNVNKHHHRKMEETGCSSSCGWGSAVSVSVSVVALDARAALNDYDAGTCPRNNKKLDTASENSNKNPRSSSADNTVGGGGSASKRKKDDDKRSAAADPPHLSSSSLVGGGCSVMVPLGASPVARLATSLLEGAAYNSGVCVFGVDNIGAGHARHLSSSDDTSSDSSAQSPVLSSKCALPVSPSRDVSRGGVDNPPPHSQDELHFLVSGLKDYEDVVARLAHQKLFLQQRLGLAKKCLAKKRSCKKKKGGGDSWERGSSDGLQTASKESTTSANNSEDLEAWAIDFTRTLFSMAEVVAAEGPIMVMAKNDDAAKESPPHRPGLNHQQQPRKQWHVVVQDIHAAPSWDL